MKLQSFSLRLPGANRLFALFAVFSMLAGSMAAFAREAADSAETESRQRYAAVWRIRGEVTAVNVAETSRRVLRQGDPVFVGERIRATSNAEAVLKTDDAGLVGVRPGVEFVTERFVAEGKPTDGSIMRIITGSLRMITGWIGITNRSGHLVRTPTATIGIRGTDHEPYVMTKEMVANTEYKPGTYDKVNRGKTALEVGKHSLDIEPGKVGFARDPDSLKQRALLTILMPVLLDKIPDFYVPGAFDDELDRFSETAEAKSLRELEKRYGPRAAVTIPEQPPEKPEPVAAEKSQAAKAATSSTAVPQICDATRLARTWVENLDAAIHRLDTPAIIGAFAADVVVRATVQGKGGGTTTIELGRDELASSTVAAINNLEDYKHRRVSLQATLPDAVSCERISLTSVVIEQGKQAGKPFRFESEETYLIEKRVGKWLAIKAETVQR